MDLPEHITTLTFGQWFNNGNQPIKKGDLPEGIKILKLSNQFSNEYQPIKKKIFLKISNH